MNRRTGILAFLILLTEVISHAGDSIPSGIFYKPEWKIGAEISPSWVPPTNIYLKGTNPENQSIDRSLSWSLRADFTLNPETNQGKRYKGLYQGIGIGMHTFFEKELMGMPWSVFVYQGAPIVHFNSRTWLSYEWEFGTTFWSKYYNKENSPENIAISTPLTAIMAAGFKFNYLVSSRVLLSAGIKASHFSNGNTSLPNTGVNTLGGSLGVTYLINPVNHSSDEIEVENDTRRWVFDLTAYGAWRKRVVYIGSPESPEICPGKFGVLGMSFSPLYLINNWVGVGPGLDVQWDESAGLRPYWIEGTYDNNIKFHRPPFVKQLSAGISGHVELTTPIFCVNVGIGYDFINPKGNKRLYQSLTLKTFVSKNIYLNVGYRLGNFQDPQNLMLGVGLRW